METNRQSKLAVGLVLGMLVLVTVFARVWRNRQSELPPVPPPIAEKSSDRIVCITDTHLLADILYEEGPAFEAMIRQDDGKVTAYVPEILAALTEEILQEQPDAVVLSGDLTLNGEKASHEQLAAILKPIQDQGIQVLVIPGNHDINNGSAASFRGTEKIYVDPVTSQQFLEIYQEFGYQQAISRDPSSLSYVYELNKDRWLLLLDTNVYEPTNRVYGELRQETCVWMQEILEQAKAKQIQVIAIGHHNLLSESRLYTQMCTLENASEVIEQLAANQVPLYISGHLHALREKKNKTEPGMPEEQYGIYERVNSALCIPPCQYMMLHWPREGTWSCETRSVDVEGWAARHGRLEEELLHFQEFSRNEFYRIISGQIADALDAGLPQELRQEMGMAYAELLYCYGAGIQIDKAEFRRSSGYDLWKRFRPDSSYLDEMEQILNDL